MLRERAQEERRAVKGFRLPMLEYEEDRLNVMERLVVDPDNTYYMHMQGDAMKGLGIEAGSLLIIDRSLEAASGAIIVVFYNGEWYTRQYIKTNSARYLKADSKEATIKLKDGDEVQIWGVVTACVNPLLPPVLRKGRYMHVCSC